MYFRLEIYSKRIHSDTAIKSAMKREDARFLITSSTQVISSLPPLLSLSLFLASLAKSSTIYSFWITLKSIEEE